MKRNLLKFFFVLLLLGLKAYAQTKTVTGTVTGKDDGVPIPGVTVTVAGTKSGTVTNGDGVYTIKVPDGQQSLTFSSVGYLTKTVPVSGLKISVALESNQRALSEVLVVGYGTALKSQSVGNTASIKGADIAERPVQSFDQALGGKAAGVQITIPNGVLNNPPVIRIRGINSISLSSYPLIIIDGVATYTGDQSGTSAAGNALAAINPNDIEDVEVLKDASAAAIYGSRAANGVILVTTKRGKKGKPVVSYDGWYGLTNVQKLPKLLDAFQYTDIKNEGLKNAGSYNDVVTTPQTKALNYYALTNGPDGQPINTRWYDYTYRQGKSMSNALNVSGGSETTNYYISINRTDQQGIVVKNDYKRTGILFNVDNKVTKAITIGAKLSYATEDNLAAVSSGSLSGQAFGTAGLGRVALVNSPNVSPYNNDGSYNLTGNSLGIMNNKQAAVGYYNPVVMIDLDRSNNYLNTLQSNVYLQVKPLPWITVKTQYGINNLYSFNDSFGNPINGDSQASGGSASESYSQAKKWVWTNTAQADRTFGKHSLSFLIGNEQERNTSQGLSATRTTLSDPAFNAFAAGYTTVSNGGSISENYLVSFFSRLNYDFDKKYLLNANVRQDQYSAFGAGKKKGTFYGVGLGWQISQEDFWATSGLDKIFSSFKLRGSYGTVGNISGLGSLASYSFYSTGLYGGASTLVPSQTGNDQIGWESSKKTDVGFTFGILKDRITFEAAYYKNTLDGLIYSVPQAPSAGLASSPQINVASMYNKGYEFTVNIEAVRKANFSWQSSFNIAYNQNKVTSLAEGITQFTSITSGLETASITKVGYPIGMIYVTRTDGVDPATGRRIFISASGQRALYQFGGSPAYTNPDGTAFVNSATGTATISGADAVIYRNSSPKVSGGFDNTFRYKKFDLGVTMTYQLGFWIYYGTNAGLHDQRYWNNSTDILNRWTTPGQVTNIPRVVANDNVSNGSSYPLDINVFKGDFLKVRNISLGYTLPNVWLNKIKVSSARIYVSAQNLITFTQYPGTDPEVSSNGNSTSTSGIERNSVANGRTITAGLSFKF